MSGFTVQNYNWQAALAAVVLGALTIVIGRYLIFKVPAFRRMREINDVEDQKRLAQEKYPALIKQGRIAGFASMAIFFLAILPFATTLESRSVGKILLEIFIILMVYDFFYYLTHRFLLHGDGSLRRIHGIHHQARDPSYIDAHYVHPIEISIGLWLFFGTVTGYALIAGPAHVASIVCASSPSWNSISSTTRISSCPTFPSRRSTGSLRGIMLITRTCAKATTATITMFYDYVFGTLD